MHFEKYFVSQIAKNEFEKNFQYWFQQILSKKDELKHRYLKVTECLEYLNQAANNPYFDNIY